MLDRNELILEGLAYTVMGILIVFLILVIIMMVINAMALLSTESKPKKTVQETKPVEETPVVTQKADDSELIAVITAAIASVMGTNTSGFVVRSYKKVSGNAWNKAGRMDILENRL